MQDGDASYVVYTTLFSFTPLYQIADYQTRKEKLFNEMEDVSLSPYGDVNSTGLPAHHQHFQFVESSTFATTPTDTWYHNYTSHMYFSANRMPE